MVGDLLKWWQSEFEAAEQDYILTRYQPMVIGDGTSGSNTPLRYIIAPDGDSRVHKLFGGNSLLGF